MLEGEREEELVLLRLVDEEYTRHPFYGSRRMVVFLRRAAACTHPTYSPSSHAATRPVYGALVAKQPQAKDTLKREDWAFFPWRILCRWWFNAESLPAPRIGQPVPRTTRSPT